MALVIKSWYANTTPDPYGNFVSIVGREEGLISYLLTAMGIDATTRFRVDTRNVYIEKGSLAGFSERVIPLSKISSSYFAYEKPWREALALTFFLSTILIGFIIGPLYYFLNKKLSLGVVEVGGLVDGIHFKRSVIEGVEINENESRRLVSILREIVSHTAAGGSMASMAQGQGMMLQPQQPQPQQQQYVGYAPPR